MLFLADEIRKKWKSLRDVFGKELKKVPDRRSGDEAPPNYETYTTWPYFESMLFLKDQMRPRKCDGNVRSDGTETIDIENSQEYSTMRNTDEQNKVDEIPEKSHFDGVNDNIVPLQYRTGKRGTQQQQRN